MNKLAVVSIVSFLTSVSSYATVTLNMFSATGGAITGLSTSTGVAGTNGLVWGVVIDADSNGFDTSSWTAGWTLNTSVNGFAIPGSSGDILYIGTSGNLTSTLAGGQGGVGGVTSISSLNILGQPTVNGSGTTLATAAGDAFAVIWFDSTVGIGGTVVDGTKVGLVQNAGLKVPGDGANVNYGTLFAGADPVRNANITIGTAIPEPSAALLGAVGALGLLRRRRA